MKEVLSGGEVIVESNDDLEIWSSIVVAFDIYGNLEVTLEFIDYTNHKYDTCVCAMVEKNELQILEKSLHVEICNIPQLLFHRFGDVSNKAVPSEVRKIFQDILEFLLDCGVRYHLKEEGGY